MTTSKAESVKLSVGQRSNNSLDTLSLSFISLAAQTDENKTKPIKKSFALTQSYWGGEC